MKLNEIMLDISFTNIWLRESSMQSKCCVSPQSNDAPSHKSKKTIAFTKIYRR